MPNPGQLRGIGSAHYRVQFPDGNLVRVKIPDISRVNARIARNWCNKKMGDPKVAPELAADLVGINPSAGTASMYVSLTK